MNYLVPLHNIDVYVSDLEIVNYERELDETLSKRNELQRKINEMLSYLCTKFPKEVEKLRSLAELYNELVENSSVQSALNGFREQNRENLDREHGENEENTELGENEKLDLNQKCKKIFRKIAKLTHPDTTHTDKYEKVFNDAKKAYTNLELSLLLAILDELENPENVGKKKKKKLEELKKKVYTSTNELKKLQSSDENSMLMDFKNPFKRPRVEAHFKYDTRSKINFLVQRIHELDSNVDLSEYTEQENAFSFVFQL